MAPEVMLNRNHDFAADYFALGVIASECMTGKRPYRGKNKNAIRDKMLAKQEVVEIFPEDPWQDYPPEAADFINKCILKNPRERIKSLKEVQDHPWFKGFDWDAVMNRTHSPLYVPNMDVRQNFDADNVNNT